MNFRTSIPLQRQSKNQIDYQSVMLLIGSCFSENIGERFAYFKFQSVVNPFGILFHPKAIEQFISDCVHQKSFTEEDIFFHNDRWQCFDAHSYLSSADKNKLIHNLNKAIASTFKQLTDATHIIITLGTSWVYRLKKNDKIVANCHKVPAQHFSKELLSIDDIVQSLLSIKSLIQSVNDKSMIIYTVSPVRHLKDGMVENQQSKSHLVAAIHRAISAVGSDTVTYFPSYEIIMDELRDYRFYATDMIHPNETAIDYIWQRFCDVWLDASTNKTKQDVMAVQKALQHRPFNPHSEQHMRFLKTIKQRQQRLQKAFPFMKF